jgi:hypothetical protein
VRHNKEEDMAGVTQIVKELLEDKGEGKNTFKLQ